MIIRRIVSANLKKGTSKKRILVTCTKTAFSFKSELYQQKDGVRMGSSLRPVLANIFVMVQLGYSRFVYDTLLVMKPGNVSQVHKALNESYKNLLYTVLMFQNAVPHLLEEVGNGATWCNQTNQKSKSLFDTFVCIFNNIYLSFLYIDKKNL